MIITFDKLKESGTVPRLHGNGFIQIDLPDGRHRLDIWPKTPLQAQTVNTGIHNHKFSFHSKILFGTLYHITFKKNPDPTGEYNVYRVIHTKTENTILVKASDRRYALQQTGSYALAAGSSYVFAAGEFHQSENNSLVVTLMSKTNMKEISALVLCQFDKKPDNDFSRYVDEKILWGEIKKAFLALDKNKIEIKL